MAKASISEVVVNGAQKVKASRIRKELTAKVGDPLNESALAADRQTLLTSSREQRLGAVAVRSVVEAEEPRGTARLTYEHFRDERKLYTFRSPLPVKIEKAADSGSVEIAMIALLGYERAFRALGDMEANEED